MRKIRTRLWAARFDLTTQDIHGFRIVRPSGEVHHIRAMAAVVCDAAGTAQRMIGTNWDITEVRTLAEQLRVAAVSRLWRRVQT